MYLIINYAQPTKIAILSKITIFAFLNMNDMPRCILNIAYRLAAALACVAAVLACEPEWDTTISIDHRPGKESVPVHRETNTERRNVLLMYSAGFNNLSGYLQEDIRDLTKGELPGNGRNEDVILIYSHHLGPSGSYANPNPPVLYRLWKDFNGNVIKDTLCRYPAETRSVSAEQLNEVLTYTKNNFPAKGYGMIFSSHATGYLPSGFYTKPDSYVYKPEASYSFGKDGRSISATAVPYHENESDPYRHLVKSIGQERLSSLSFEMELGDFAAAIPFRLDYLLFDACLMSGIEVAYELKDKCRQIAFSPAEVLVEGFNYTTLASHLAQGNPDPQAVCEDYFMQYDIKTGEDRSATITLVNCDELEPVAEFCRDFFAAHRVGLDNVDHNEVQRYFRYDYHWFYDLKDIMIESGASEEELAELDRLLDRAIIYKAATPSFMKRSGGFEVEVYSGLSMYLPSNGNKELSKYYKTLSWNEATGLVE